MSYITSHFRAAGPVKGRYTVRTIEADEWEEYMPVALDAYHLVFMPPHIEDLWEEREWREELEEPGLQPFGLYHEGRLIGISHLYNSNWPGIPEGTANISVFVKEEYRKQQLAMVLCMHAIQQAAQKSLNVVRAEIGVGNWSSRKMFRGLGFKKDWLTLKDYTLDLDKMRNGKGPQIFCYNPR